MKLTDRVWKEFKIDDVFEIFSKKVINKKQTKLGNDIDYITRTLKNQGVLYKVKKPKKEHIITKNKITITGGGQPGVAFYRENDYCAGVALLSLSLKNKELNKKIGLFLSVCLSELQKKYSYGYAINKERLKQEKIWLPVDKNNEIDYDFMEEFIKEKENNYKRDKNFNGMKEKQTNLLETEWKEFKIEDIFNTNICKSLDINKTEKGKEINYITRQTNNNGLKNKIKFPESSFVYSANCLTMVMVGEPGKTFYQTDQFCASQNICRITMKVEKMNKEIGIFISTCLSKIKVKYSYGYPISLKRLKNEKIWLPTDKEGNINYEFMENYIEDFKQKEN